MVTISPNEARRKGNKQIPVDQRKADTLDDIATALEKIEVHLSKLAGGQIVIT